MVVVTVRAKGVDEFLKKFLYALGFQIENAVRKEAIRMKLVDSSNFVQSIQMKVENNNLVIFSDAPYAVYLEYGTLEYWQQFREQGFPDPGYPTIPKKKEISKKAAESLPKGMQPFAPFRRVLYNPKKMQQIVEKAIRSI